MQPVVTGVPGRHLSSADFQAAVLRSLRDYVSSLPPPKWKFDDVLTVWWKIYPRLGLRGFATVPPQFILEHRANKFKSLLGSRLGGDWPTLDNLRYTLDEIRLPEGATVPDNAVVVAEDLLAVTDIGAVYVGSFRGGPRVVLKYSDDDADPDGWKELFTEAFNYHLLAMAGLAHYIPRCYGLWQERKLTMLIVEHVGTAFECWGDLDDAQWVLLCNAVRALHAAGFHHGDLLPRNVCLDDAG